MSPIPPAVRAISLDVGSTLIDPHPSVGHIYAEIAARHGHPNLSPDLLNDRFRDAFRNCPQPLHSASDWSGLVDRCFLGLVHPPPSETFFEALYHRFTEPTAWHVYPDVLPALAQLRSRSLRLAVISNWDNRLRPLLHDLQLAPFFSAIVISCEFGRPKPDPAIFLHAASQLGLPPSAVLHIGDHPQHDVQAARNAGFHALLLDRRDSAASCDPPHRLASLALL